jgi:asparagine synthase (glutamine-hydrolysing)
VLLAMTDAIVHRGPDSGGLWCDEGAQVALGHRRLSIIDLSPSGSQPMTSQSGRWKVVFNGEIYNHLELRAELASSVGRSDWIGHSDTETLLGCLDVWGIEGTLRRLVGMFAFALWSQTDQRLHLVRDRFGEKPLYFGWLRSARDVLVFGSELRALERHPAFETRVDRAALSGYMRSLCVGGEKSIAAGVSKVPPGTVLTFSLASPGAQSSATYWSSVDPSGGALLSSEDGISDEEAITSLDRYLRRSIRGQMLSDVPLGAFLSGGVDSSAVVAVMQALSGRPVKTFSIGFTEAAFDESGYARKVARHLGTDHTDLMVSPERAMQVIPDLGKVYDEPFADSSQIPTLLVSRLAREQVTVALSGDAGDEVFGGYNRYVLAHRHWPLLSRIPAVFRRSAGDMVLRLSPQQLSALGRFFGAEKKLADVGAKIQKAATVLGARTLEDLYRQLTMVWRDPVVLGVPREEEGGASALGRWPEDSDVRRMMHADLCGYLPDDILAKVDRAAMSTSLETRVPFLDHRLVEWSMGLPLRFKIRNVDGKPLSKWLLRQVLYQYVPPSLIERPKMGFGIPLADWLRGPLAEWAESLLDPVVLRAGGFFDAALVQRRWGEHRSGVRDWSHHLWCVLMFQCWLFQKDRSRYT